MNEGVYVKRRRRNELSKEKINSVLQLDVQGKKILRARTEALAAESQVANKDEACIEILEFILSYEHYGIETSYIEQVYPLKEYTPLPCTPSFILGIMNVCGLILSIIDIKKFFDLPAKGLAEWDKVIIVHNNEMEFGILADAIVGIKSILLDEIQTSLPTITGVREKY